MDIEQLKRETARLDHEALQKDAELRLGYQVEFSHNALKALTLANGGAIVALFTLLGNVDNARLAVDAGLIWWAFAAFTSGLVCTFVASFGAFFSQSFYMLSSQQEAWEKQAEMLGAESKYDHLAEYQKGEKAEFVGIVAAILSLILFAFGGGFALASVLP